MEFVYSGDVDECKNDDVLGLTIEDPENGSNMSTDYNDMNSTTTRSTKFTPLVLIGVKMKQKEDLQIKHLLEDELSEQFINKRETPAAPALFKENILRLQDENKKQSTINIVKPVYNYKPVHFPVSSQRRGRRHQMPVDISYRRPLASMIELKCTEVVSDGEMSSSCCHRAQDENL
ncbi:hypothetical protein TNCV_4849471 [Trichonephila clavipes]|nr:hypothetical protein TNCV_4849471 [Trichonephila clavipes]